MDHSTPPSHRPDASSSRLSPSPIVELLDASGQIIVALDASGSVTFINQRGAELLGWTQDELIGRDWFDCCVPERERQMVRTAFLEAVDGPDFSEQHLIQTLTRGGSSLSIRWTNTTIRDENGHMTSTLSFGRDVTAELETEQLANRLAAIIEATPDLVGTIDADGTMVYMNEAARRLARVDDDEDLSAYSIHSFQPEETVQTLMETALPTALREGSWEGFTAVKHPDGREIPVSQVLISHLDDEQNQFFSSILRDRSEVVAWEQRIMHLNSRLELSNARLRASLKAEHEFVANVSHELRTPLNSIIGFTGVMRDGRAGPITDEQERQLDMVYHSGRHLLALINDLLNMSTIQAGTQHCEPERFVLCEVAQLTVDTIRPIAQEKDIQLGFSCTDEQAIVFQDRKKIEQVLINLIQNAVKYTLHGNIDVSLSVSDGSIRIDVEDTGIGIPAEELDSVFGKFHQVSRTDVAKSEGTGLGLAICEALAEIMGGTVTVQSTEGAGSTFTFIAPAEYSPPSESDVIS